MIRFLCRESDMGAACNVGGPVHVDFRTFTDAAEFERWMNDKMMYRTRECLGVEVVAEPKEDVQP